MQASSWEADLLALASGRDERKEGGGGARPTATDADFAHCDRVTREHSTTFYAATRLLPAEKRRGVRALYAFCRVADDIVDEPGGDREGRLRAWGAAGTGAAESDGDPVLRAWGATREAFGIEVHLAGQLIEALANDLDHRGYEDWPGLARYCYGVAATVGLMSMRIIGSKGEPALYAIRLGVAMQLTNILRDVAEDWRNGRARGHGTIRGDRGSLGFGPGRRGLAGVDAFRSGEGAGALPRCAAGAGAAPSGWALRGLGCFGAVLAHSR
ncbi:MAG: hypothetical protein C4321_07230 [Chloroflexota bacterium]